MEERKDGTQIFFEEKDCFSNGKKYKVTIKVPISKGWIDAMYLIFEDGEKNQEYGLKHVRNDKDFIIFDTELFLETKAVYRYFFKYSIHGKVYYVGDIDTKEFLEYDEKNKMSVGFSVPTWAKGAMMYHIFVDRFKRGSKEPLCPMDRRDIHFSWNEDVVLGDNKNVKHYKENEQVWNVDFYGGDLKGIIDSLDYLESMGIDILYLSPIVKSQSNHRYDSADYEQVDPYAGCNEDLKELCLEAHKRGMKVILDAVFNHTGDESKYFDRYEKYGNGSFHHVDSPYRKFYRMNGEHFEYWWGFHNLPETNSGSKEWQEYICGVGGVIDQWFLLGIDGLRLDVADELSDEFIELIRDAVRRNKSDGFILGEVWENPMRFHRGYLSSGKGMDSVMNYPLTDALMRYFKYHDATKLAYIVRDIKAEYPKDTIDTLMNFTSTHDISRAITIFGTKKFDGNCAFSTLSDSIKRMIYEVLIEINYSQDDIMGLFYGSKEMDYYSYQRLMNRLREKGVDDYTIQYLRKNFFYTPFHPYDRWTKDIVEEVKNDLNYTAAYRLTDCEYQMAKDVYESYLFYLASWPGILSIFYGDEVGMQGLNNLVNRRPFPWGMEDKELLEFVRLLGMYRKNNPMLKTACSHMIELDDEHVSFERRLKNEGIFVGINNTREEREIYIPEEYRDGEEILTLKKSNKHLLAPNGGIVIRK